MQKKWKLLFGVAVLLTVNIYYFTLKFSNAPSNIQVRQQPKTYTLNTYGCHIPYLNPLHPSVAQHIKSQPPLTCTTKLSSPVIPGDNLMSPSIKMFQSVLKQYSNNTRCTYQALHRKSEDIIIEDKQKHVINDDVVPVSDEFIKVECVANKSTVFMDYFPFIQKKKSVEDRCQKAKATHQPDERLNVILIGIDSMSNLNFLRQMKKTLDYIDKHVIYVPMTGYTKIGKNTYPNIVGMLTGHLESELKDTSKVHADTLPLVWKEFSEHGYRVLYGEDWPSVTGFNFARKGFNTQPTDYYLRPFSVAIESSPIVIKGKRGCFNNRLEADVILGWAGDFFDVFRNDSTFSFTFSTRLSHDYINDLSLLDKPYMQFIKRLKEQGHLERSIVFLFGDHGLRFGSIRNTFVGRMEGKLPAMYVFVPSWFPSKYSQLYKNLVDNSHRLTTALDVHATMRHILHFDGKSIDSSTGRSVSLFSGPISENRTCKDAGIADQFCPCKQLQQVSPSDPHVVEAARHLVNTINTITKINRTMCSKLKLDAVTHAVVHHVHLGEEISANASSNYQVTFRVKPSDGIFEGIVWYLAEKNTYHPQEEIDRINVYGNQSICIQEALLKPFCYCNV